MSTRTPAERRTPEQVYRIGFVSASIFAHDVESNGATRELRSVSIQKRYLDGDEPKYTSSFGLAELLQALRALQLAQEYIEAREADFPLGD